MEFNEYMEDHIFKLHAHKDTKTYSVHEHRNYIHNFYSSREINHNFLHSSDLLSSIYSFAFLTIYGNITN